MLEYENSTVRGPNNGKNARVCNKDFHSLLLHIRKWFRLRSSTAWSLPVRALCACVLLLLQTSFGGLFRMRRLCTAAAKRRVALYAGSFDPPSKGHLDIITRALKLCDFLHVSVATNPNKKNVRVKASGVAVVVCCGCGSCWCVRDWVRAT